MHHPTTRRAARATHRTQKSSLDPYVLDDVAFTLSDIRRARAEGEPTAVPLRPIGGVGTFGPISAPAPAAR